MPPKNPGSMAADLEQLLLVGENGIGAVKGAKWILPPAKGEAATQVGDDYPYMCQATRNLTPLRH
jgi:hypothetical protein